MNTKQTIILYSILGIVSLLLAYITYIAANVSSLIPENPTQGVLILVFACSTLTGILFFIPVATGLILLTKRSK